jgi:inorganic triphosphatase YgiF
VVGGEVARAGSEIELKFDFDPGTAGLIAAHPALRASPSGPEQRELISIYYDTEDGALRKAGVFLRVRESGGRYTQTIKSARNQSDLIERLEWEQAIESRHPDLAAAEATALEPLLTAEIRAALQPRFETRVQRYIYRIACGSSEIEVAVDRGEIATATRNCQISELELELKRGDKAALFDLARVLAEGVPLRLAVKSKAERGFELIDDADHSVEKASPIVIAPQTTSRDAFRAIAQSCLRQIVANEAGTCAGDAEALHQTRVGLRRLRAAIAFFADMVTDRHLGRIKAELKWITKELGPAREFDVFAAEVLQPLRAAHPEDDGLDAAHRDFEAKREAAYARARSSVRSDRFRSVPLDIAEWVEVGAWTSEKDEAREAGRKRPVVEHAETELRRLRKRIKKKGGNLNSLSGGQRHKLRIRAKRLRYATEFFAATFPGEEGAKRRETSLAALKDLQDALGGLNDLATHKTLIAGHGAAGDGSLAKHVGASEAGAEKLLAAATVAYRRFAGTKPFWKG